MVKLSRFAVEWGVRCCSIDRRAPILALFVVFFRFLRIAEHLIGYLSVDFYDLFILG